MAERAKRVVLSCFVVLNLFTVLFVNRPALMVQGEDKVTATLDEGWAHALRYARWLAEQYAFFTGLNNQWRMFGDPSRYHWRYLIKARYQDGEEVVLPVPGQRVPTFWESVLFDFKEAKFRHTLYTRPAAREAYAHYLARQYPAHDGSPISSVIIELYWQRILSPEEARARNAVLDTAISSQVPQTVDFEAQ